jgi:hypothetical protein
MAITIAPAQTGPFLYVAGDVRTTLVIPAEAPESTEDGQLVDSYYISLSDGTLIQASYGDDPEFHVVVEGAARVSIAPSGKELTADWTIEWINVAPSRSAIGLAHREPARLPLFDLRGEAA